MIPESPDEALIRGRRMVYDPVRRAIREG